MWLVSDNGNRIDWIASKRDKFSHNEFPQSFNGYVLKTYLVFDDGNVMRYKSEQFTGKVLNGESIFYYPNGVEANNTFYRDGKIGQIIERYPNGNLKIIVTYNQDGIDVKTFNMRDGKIDLHEFLTGK
jgi:antitoxin component YwqK of YwqJK toxin-antitoxin module